MAQHAVARCIRKDSPNAVSDGPGPPMHRSVQFHHGEDAEINGRDCEQLHLTWPEWISKASAWISAVALLGGPDAGAPHQPRGAEPCEVEDRDQRDLIAPSAL